MVVNHCDCHFMNFKHIIVFLSFTVFFFSNFVCVFLASLFIFFFFFLCVLLFWWLCYYIRFRDEQNSTVRIEIATRIVLMIKRKNYWTLFPFHWIFNRYPYNFFIYEFFIHFIMFNLLPFSMLFFKLFHIKRKKKWNAIFIELNNFLFSYF